MRLAIAATTMPARTQLPIPMLPRGSVFSTGVSTITDFAAGGGGGALLLAGAVLAAATLALAGIGP